MINHKEVSEGAGLIEKTVMQVSEENLKKILLSVADRT